VRNQASAVRAQNNLNNVNQELEVQAEINSNQNLVLNLEYNEYSGNNLDLSQFLNQLRNQENFNPLYNQNNLDDSMFFNRGFDVSNEFQIYNRPDFLDDSGLHFNQSFEFIRANENQINRVEEPSVVRDEQFQELILSPIRDYERFDFIRHNFDGSNESLNIHQMAESFERFLLNVNSQPSVVEEHNVNRNEEAPDPAPSANNNQFQNPNNL
jgi:hypothetical protein